MCQPRVHGRMCNFGIRDQILITPYLPVQAEPGIMFLGSLRIGMLKAGYLTISYLSVSYPTALGLEGALVQPPELVNDQLTFQLAGTL